MLALPYGMRRGEVKAPKSRRLPALILANEKGPDQ
jgi:hypothetical protein